MWDDWTFNGVTKLMRNLIAIFFLSATFLFQIKFHFSLINFIRECFPFFFRKPRLINPLFHNLFFLPLTKFLSYMHKMYNFRYATLLINSYQNSLSESICCIYLHEIYRMHSNDSVSWWMKIERFNRLAKCEWSNYLHNTVKRLAARPNVCSWPLRAFKRPASAIFGSRRLRVSSRLYYDVGVYLCI